MAKVVLCETMVKPLRVEFPSSSQAGVKYTTFGTTIFSDSFCDCPGFQFRGQCKHVSFVDNDRCDYRFPARPYEEIHDVDKCPGCGENLCVFELEPEFE